MDLFTLNARIRDRITIDWLTPSQLAVWNDLMRFDGPPHRVINIYGSPGVGKTFLGWLLERERLATYGDWHEPPRPIHPRLVLDNARSDHASVRDIRPLVDKWRVHQIIILSRRRAEEPAMPAFELRVDSDDFDAFRANLYRHLRISIPDAEHLDFSSALESLTLEE